MVEPY